VPRIACKRVFFVFVSPGVETNKRKRVRSATFVRNIIQITRDSDVAIYRKYLYELFEMKIHDEKKYTMVHDRAFNIYIYVCVYLYF